MENTNLEILPIKVIKDNIYHPIELYFSELITSNVYIGEDIKKKLYFMIKIPCEKISEELITEMTLINYFPSDKVLHSINIFKKNNEDAFLIFNYCSGIRLNDFIQYSQPSFLIRLNLLKQFSECLIDLYNNNIKLYNLNSDFFFVLDIESPNLKILLNIFGLIQSESDNQNKKNQEKEDEFFWLARFIFIISSEGNQSNNNVNNNFFDFFINSSPEIIRNDLKKIINSIFFRCKGNEEYIKNYHIQNYINDLNIILNKLNINAIDKEIIKNELRENFVTKVIERAIKEQSLNPQIESSDNEKNPSFNYNILGVGIQKKIKKKSLKKKDDNNNQIKIDLKDNLIYGDKQNPIQQILNFDNFQNNQYQNQFQINQNNIFPYSFQNSFQSGNQYNMMDYDMYQNNVNNNGNYTLYSLQQCINQMIFSFKQLDNEINSQIKQMEKDIKLNEFKTYEEYLDLMQEKK